MVGASCAVALCRNSYGKVGKDNTDNPRMSFHRFPVNQHIQKQWISLCKRSGKFNSNTWRICSEHFKPEDFSRDLRAELLGYSPRIRLLPETIPSRNLPNDPNRQKTDSAARSLKRAETKKEHKVSAAERGRYYRGKRKKDVDREARNKKKEHIRKPVEDLTGRDHLQIKEIWRETKAERRNRTKVREAAMPINPSSAPEPELNEDGSSLRNSTVLLKTLRDPGQLTLGVPIKQIKQEEDHEITYSDDSIEIKQEEDHGTSDRGVSIQIKQEEDCEISDDGYQNDMERLVATPEDQLMVYQNDQQDLMRGSFSSVLYETEIVAEGSRQKTAAERFKEYRARKRAQRPERPKAKTSTERVQDFLARKQLTNKQKSNAINRTQSTTKRRVIDPMDSDPGINNKAEIPPPLLWHTDICPIEKTGGSAGSSMDGSSQIIIKNKVIDLAYEVMKVDEHEDEGDSIQIKQEIDHEISNSDSDTLTSDEQTNQDLDCDFQSCDSIKIKQEDHVTDNVKSCYVWLKETHESMMPEEPTNSLQSDDLQSKPINNAGIKSITNDIESKSMIISNFKDQDVMKMEEYEAIQIIWSSKLRRLDETQKVLAEDLINQILKKGFYKQLTRTTTLCKDINK